MVPHMQTDCPTIRSLARTTTEHLVGAMHLMSLAHCCLGQMLMLKQCVWKHKHKNVGVTGHTMGVALKG